MYFGKMILQFLLLGISDLPLSLSNEILWQHHVDGVFQPMGGARNQLLNAV